MNDEAKKETDKISEIEKTIDREKLVYRASEYTYSFQNFQTKTFGRDIYNGEITLKEADEEQSSLLSEIKNFGDKIKPQDEGKKKTEKKDVLKNLHNFFEGREKVLNAVDSKIFPINAKGSGYLKFKPSSFNILTPNQSLKDYQ